MYGGDALCTGLPPAMVWFQKVHLWIIDKMPRVLVSASGIGSTWLSVGPLPCLLALEQGTQEGERPSLMETEDADCSYPDPKGQQQACLCLAEAGRALVGSLSTGCPMGIRMVFGLDVMRDPLERRGQFRPCGWSLEKTHEG
jgi:hypothetical protein